MNIGFFPFCRCETHETNCFIIPALIMLALLGIALYVGESNLCGCGYNNVTCSINTFYGGWNHYPTLEQCNEWGLR